MNFGEAFKALKEGKKIRRKTHPSVILYKGQISQFFKTETMPSLIREVNGQWSHSDLYGRYELFADDWEIVPEIPEIEIYRSNDTYLDCPRCGKTDEIIVYIEDIKNNCNIRTCRFCGQSFKITNLGEFNGSRRP